MNLRRSGNGVQNSMFALQSAQTVDREALDQNAFRRIISIERKRTERSRKPFLLMLLDLGGQPNGASSLAALTGVVSTLLQTTRETDVVGWYETETVVGAMFTELGAEDRNEIMSTMFLRINSMLQEQLPAANFDRINISFHLFPEDWDCQSPERPSNPAFYPDLDKRDEGRKVRRIVKRTIDILGSVAALTIGSPLFLLIALAIKLTSKGPVFYRQQRIGEYGTAFSFIKFRSMYQDNDCSAHKDYVQRLIAGVAQKQEGQDGKAVYKITRDPRVTPVGAFLRRTSLDELPQFINVLRGEMSLVGPRPPIDYEVERYHLWHRRRLLEAKPGITGLWQVMGRNTIGFDDMVRLDLQYANSWTPWLDLKILLQTPKAMVEGAH